LRVRPRKAAEPPRGRETSNIEPILRSEATEGRHSTFNIEFEDEDEDENEGGKEGKHSTLNIQQPTPKGDRRDAFAVAALWRNKLSYVSSCPPS
jgi:hypothetical protein